MPLSFFFDQHVPVSIARSLRFREIDVLTAFEDKSDSLDDERLMLRAGALGRILFTRDDDLLALPGHEYQRTRSSFSGILFAHEMRVSIGRCVTERMGHRKCDEPRKQAWCYLPQLS